MKIRKQIQILIIMMGFCLICKSQTQQLKKWFFAPNEIDVSTTAPTVTTIPGCTLSASLHYASGIYDGTSNHNLLFYVYNDFSNVYIYDRLNNLMNTGGSIAFTLPGQNDEVAIVPSPDNDGCLKNKYYVITMGASPIGSTSCGASETILYYAIVDMSLNAGLGDISSGNSWVQIDAICGMDGGGIAIGKPLNGQRFLYFCGTNPSTQGEIHKLTISSSGISSPTTIFTATNVSLAFVTSELDISPNGDYLALASMFDASTVTNRYSVIGLNSSGNYNGTFLQFNIGGTLNNSNDGGRGVEFYQNGSTTKLFVGAGGDGIYEVDIPSLSSQQISGTNPNYGNSQIEMANNGFLYAGSSSNIAAINPAPATPVMIPGSDIPLVAPNDPPGTGVDFFTLPDQLDGENYDNILFPLPPVWSTTNFTASMGTSTWTMGNNPITGLSNPSEITIENLLTIPVGSDITLDHMNIKFAKGARLIIEQGATLTVIGGVFTSACEGMWQGIEVWGDKNASQTLSPGSFGKLVLSDNVLIENALNSITLWQPDDWGTTGGIIQATNASFKNNQRSVEFRYYHNYIIKGFSPLLLVKRPNMSFFKDCHFEINDDYLEWEDHPFWAHVSMYEVWGINLTACSFNNSKTGITTYNQLGRGIDVFDAGFSVNSYCNYTCISQPGSPCAGSCWHQSTFDGLQYGIRSLGNRIYPFTADQVLFNNNISGMYVGTVNNISSTRNLFYVGNNQTNFNVQTGISLYSASGFRIEENHMIKSGINNINTYGVFASATGPANNQTYRNTFTGLTIGQYGIGSNRDNTMPFASGLQFLCNTNHQITRTDFLVAGVGIRLNQGDIRHPAGNSFSLLASPSYLYSDYDNFTSTVLNYYYDNNPQITIRTPRTSRIRYVNLYTTDENNSCISNFESGSNDHLSTAERAALINKYDTSEAAYLNLLYNYNELINGGNTNALLEEIEHTWPNEAWDLRNTLLNQSPYLSQEILRETALQNILPQAMLLEVILANPDATRDIGFIDFLQNEIPNPLPQYMLDLIVASWEEATGRTMFESQLAFYNHSMAIASDILLIDMYLDTTDIDYTDSIHYWLNRVQTIPAKYQLAENYLHDGNYSQANSVLESIPNNFTLTAEDLDEYNRYLYYFDFRSDIQSENRNLMQLTNEEVILIQNFAEDANDLPGNMAKNLLCFGYNICNDEAIPDPPEGGGQRIAHSNKQEALKELNKINVLPNPAITYASFSYQLPLLKYNAILGITDVTGRPIQQFTITQKQGVINWDTRKITKGVYLYQIKEADGVIGSGKVVVEK